MLKYVSKFAMDILPSVAATIIGAYIVNHYIVTRPAAEAPVAAAVSSADPKKPAPRIDAKPAETSADVANLPEAGVRAKGISEKAIFEKPAAGAAETASIPADPRRHQLASREKTVAKTVPVPVQPATSAVAPVIAAPNSALPIEAAIVPEEHRDANDLARAAIERLRSAGDGSPHAQQEAARTPDAVRIAEPSRAVSASPVRPLPPPIMVSTPAAETSDSTGGLSQTRQPYPAAAQIDDPRRPTPPADIPGARPLDLRAEATETMPAREHTTVAQDMLSAAKSVFHAVLPQ
jgi:hypothetical protein